MQYSPPNSYCLTATHQLRVESASQIITASPFTSMNLVSLWRGNSYYTIQIAYYLKTYHIDTYKSIKCLHYCVLKNHYAIL